MIIKPFNITKCFAVGLTAAVLSMGAARASQQSDQVAVQLGAIQLGITLDGATTAQNLANCLVQGRNFMAAKATMKDGSIYYVGSAAITPASVQRSTAQEQLQMATQRALSNPVTNLVGIKGLSVTTTTGTKTKTTKVTAVLDPQKTTAAAVFSVTSKLIPNFGPDLVKYGVEAAMRGGGTPVFNYKGKDAAAIQKAQITDAAKIAQAALSASLKTYVSGTVNWAKVPKTGPLLGARYLPNFSANTIPTKAAPGGTTQASHLIGISSSAAAISANAINGLGAISGLYGKTSANVQALTTSLVKGANAFQKTSMLNGTTSVGAIGAATLGIVAQVAGVENNNWGLSLAANDTNAILQGIVTGAVKAAKSQMSAIAAGVAQGFTGTYLVTKTNVKADNLVDFKTANVSDILNSFVLAGAVKLGTTAATNLQLLIGDSIAQAYTKFGYDTNGDRTLVPAISDLTGAPGIKDFALVNGVGSPVTDTVGL